jgi:hypothetical protein
MWGFEPQQNRLKDGCSTVELHTPHLYKVKLKDSQV